DEGDVVEGEMVQVAGPQAQAGQGQGLALPGQSARDAGYRLVTDAEEIAKHGSATDGLTEVEELPRTADLCLVLGGDGTILRALRHHAGTPTPVFGVNFGTVGFLAAVERDQAVPGIACALAGECETLALPGLRLRAGDLDHLAFNDVTFIRRPHARVAELAYRITGEEVGHVSCDGLVVSTPTGSTGYNLANNGPILAWGVEGYVVSYIAPHTLTARALVVAPGDVLHVGNAAAGEAVEIEIDGQRAGALDEGTEAELTFQPGAAQLAQLPGTSFYNRIREKFGHLAV
ncbi:MAG TPA: NAD(+)/NADH kinase, partial [Solirubrobacterales bacterium]|nr:NAD(+)/NADH kinase [Solirubrobacterales bacterium]